MNDDLIRMKADNTLSADEQARWDELVESTEKWEFSGTVLLDGSDTFIVGIPVCRVAVVVHNFADLELETRERIAETLGIDFDNITLALEHQY